MRNPEDPLLRRIAGLAFLDAQEWLNQHGPEPITVDDVEWASGMWHARFRELSREFPELLTPSPIGGGMDWELWKLHYEVYARELENSINELIAKVEGIGRKSWTLEENPDPRLRELERKFSQTGLPEDEAALLVARVRAGDLPRNRLRLAASLGYEPALLAHPREENWALEPVGQQGIRPDWASLLLGGGPEGAEGYMLRVAIASCQSINGIAGYREFDWGLLREIVKLGRNYLVAWIHGKNVQRRILTNSALLISEENEPGGREPSPYTSLAYAMAGFRGRQHEPEFAVPPMRECFLAYTHAVSAWQLYLENIYQLSSNESGPEAHERVLRFVRRELIPWILGYG